MAASTAQILYLRLGDNAQVSIYDDLYKSLHTQIASLCSITEAKTLAAAQSLLSTQSFKAVLAVDGGIAIRRNNALQKQLASYAKNGGTVIFCCLFSSFVRPPDMDKLWQNFEQPWKSGDYHRTTFYLSQKVKTILGSQRAAGLEREYSAKALHLKDVPVASRVYVPLEQSRIESRVFAPQAVDNSQTPAAYHKYDDGWVGYIGDVNNEDGSQALLLAMLDFALSSTIVPLTVAASSPSTELSTENGDKWNPGCSVCGKLKPVKRCGRCREEQYCSVECQKADWKSHKGFCGTPESDSDW